MVKGRGSDVPGMMWVRTRSLHGHLPAHPKSLDHSQLVGAHFVTIFPAYRGLRTGLGQRAAAGRALATARNHAHVMQGRPTLAKPHLSRRMAVV